VGRRYVGSSFETTLAFVSIFCSLSLSSSPTASDRYMSAARASFRIVRV